MQHAHLGDSRLRVSRFCLGLENLYVHRFIDEEDAVSMLDEALHLGINFINIGGADLQELIGNWLSKDKRRRGQVVLATFARNETPEPDLSPYSSDGIRRSCENSLRRLGTDRIDLVQFDHWCDTPWDEIWQASEQLVQTGKVLHVGSANFAAWQIAQGNEAARRRGFKGFVSEQSVYNLLQRTIEPHFLLYFVDRAGYIQGFNRNLVQVRITDYPLFFLLQETVSVIANQRDSSTPV